MIYVHNVYVISRYIIEFVYNNKYNNNIQHDMYIIYKVYRDITYIIIIIIYNIICT